MVLLNQLPISNSQLPKRPNSEGESRFENHQSQTDHKSTIRNLQCGACSGARLLRIAIGGVVCALLVLATGWLVQRVALGVDDAGMRMKVETEVRSAFDRMARRLRTMAVQTSDLPTIRAALDGDTSAVRRCSPALLPSSQRMRRSTRH